ncbi:hypothetical protein VTK56DRAFT_4106 [Thermocarpiscus australiensis]
MVRFAISTLALAAATASALPGQQSAASESEGFNLVAHLTQSAASKSKGFNLVAHVTDPDSDLTPSVEGLLLTTAHTGAGLSAAVFEDQNGRIFYQNGTARDESTLLTDGGTPPFPFSLQVQPAGEARRIVDISMGQGTFHYVDARGRLVNALGAGTWLACDAVVPYYNQTFTTLQYAYDGVADPAGREGCATIELRARCTELNELPDDAYSTHEFAKEVHCEK